MLSRELLTRPSTLTLEYRGIYIGPGGLHRIEPTGMLLGHKKRTPSIFGMTPLLSAHYVVSQTYDMQRVGKHLGTATLIII